MTNRLLYLNEVSPSDYRNSLRALGWKITDQYDKLIRMGYPQDVILEFVRNHIATIDGSATWNEDEKAAAKLDLARFVKDKLPQAPADWATAPVSVFTDDEIRQINQSKVMRSYVDYLSYCNPTTRKEDVEAVEPEKLLAEGWVEVLRDDGDVLLTEQASGNVDLLGWLRRNVKPHKQSRASGAGSLGSAASMVAGAKAAIGGKTHVFFHPHLKLFVGHVAGKSFKPTSERGFFTHLVKNHGFDAHHAQHFVETVRGGNPSGHGPTKAQNHLEHALHYAKLAKTAHDSFNHDDRDKHLSVVGHHLDKAHLLAHDEMKKNSKPFLGAHHEHHPLMAHVHAISHIMKGIPG